MTNQTIDGVPRELLENAARCIERYQFGTDWAKELRALLEAPAVNTDVRTILLDVVPGDGDGHEVYAKCCDEVVTLLGKQADRIEELEAAQPQGEPFAWYTEDYLSDKSATTYDLATMERWKAKGWPVTPLYAEQPAPVAVPERLVMTDGLHTYEYVTGHNDCIDKMLGVKS